MFDVFITGLILVFQWPDSVGLFPLIAVVPGTVLLLLVLVGDVRGCRAERVSSNGWMGALRSASEKAVLPEWLPSWRSSRRIRRKPQALANPPNAEKAARPRTMRRTGGAFANRCDTH